MSSYKSKVLALAEKEGIEIEYGYDRESKTHSVEAMSYGTNKLIEDCHSYVIDSSLLDRHQLDLGLGKMEHSWKAMYEVLTAPWALGQCPGCEGCE